MTYFIMTWTITLTTLLLFNNIMDFTLLKLLKNAWLCIFYFLNRSKLIVILIDSLLMSIYLLFTSLIFWGWIYWYFIFWRWLFKLFWNDICNRRFNSWRFYLWYISKRNSWFYLFISLNIGINFLNNLLLNFNLILFSFCLGNILSIVIKLIFRYFPSIKSRTIDWFPYKFSKLLLITITSWWWLINIIKFFKLKLFFLKDFLLNSLFNFSLFFDFFNFLLPCCFWINWWSIFC